MTELLTINPPATEFTTFQNGEITPDTSVTSVEFVEPSVETFTRFIRHPLFPKVDEETYFEHIHLSKVMSTALRDYIKVDLTPDTYFTILNEYISAIKPTNGKTLFDRWDLDKYTIYHVTYKANERRGSVRTPWEAMAKGLALAEFFDEQRRIEPEAREKYNEFAMYENVNFDGA